jgi:hypothetical protein
MSRSKPYRDRFVVDIQWGFCYMERCDLVRFIIP